MKILHTSDWHLGKIFHEFSFIDDQKEMLNQLLQELKNAEENNNPYDALFVAGDIYDRQIPPVEAVNLFSSFLFQVRNQFPKLELFFIAGNHDSAARLAFAKEILKNEKIHICSDTKTFCKPVILSNEKESVAVYQLPFLMPHSICAEEKTGEFSFDEGTPLKKQQELFQEACIQIKKSHETNYSKSLPVLIAHLFTLNSSVSDSERSFVGTAEQVDASLFDFFSYTALGHLHGFQPCGKNQTTFYSGSPLAYSFEDSQNTYFLSVEIAKDSKPKVTKIPVKPLHRLVKLEGAFADFYGETADSKVISENKNNYVEIVCTDSVMPVTPMALLRKNFPFIMSFIQKNNVQKAENNQISQRRVAIQSNNSEKIFEQFIQELYGENACEDELVKKEKEVFLTETKNYSWEVSK